MNIMDKKKIEVMVGGVAKDQRGQIRFVNEFDMTQVKRFYIIKNHNTRLVRGWRGHRMEQRWFYVLSGAFSVDLVEIDDWENASRTLSVETRILATQDQQVLHVPAGYATAFQAVGPDSELLVFADYGIENAKHDDHIWPEDYFLNRDSASVTD